MARGWGSSWTDVCLLCYPYGRILPSWTGATAPGELPGELRANISLPVFMSFDI